MTHRERFLTAINHQESDRVPICAWYTPEAEKALLRHMGVESDQIETYEAAGGPLPILMDHDFLISWVGPCTSYYSDPRTASLLPAGPGPDHPLSQCGRQFGAVDSPWTALARMNNACRFVRRLYEKWKKSPFFSRGMPSGRGVGFLTG